MPENADGYVVTAPAPGSVEEDMARRAEIERQLVEIDRRLKAVQAENARYFAEVDPKIVEYVQARHALDRMIGDVNMLATSGHIGFRGTNVFLSVAGMMKGPVGILAITTKAVLAILLDGTAGAGEALKVVG